MLSGFRTRIIPTPEQEAYFWKAAGIARWAFNYHLGRNFDRFKQWLDNNKQGYKSISSGVIRKELTELSKTPEYTWLRSVAGNIRKQAVIDADKALKDYRTGKKGKPNFKQKFETKPSFYLNYESFKPTPHGFRGEKLGFVRTTKPIPKSNRYANPRISFDGKNWFISVGIEIPTQNVTLTNRSIGIDVGLKELAVTSDGVFYSNINKSKRIKQLEKRHRREQRKLSRRLERNIKHRTYYKTGKKKGQVRKITWIKPLKDCANIQRQKKVINRLYIKLTNIRQNYLHQVTTEIIKTYPSRIVVETLNIRGLMKNKHLAKAFSDQKLYEFSRQLQYKSKKYNIEFVKADSWFPSSKLCSCCGHKKSDLKLKDRTYYCTECGFECDRDLNASYNLAGYAI